MRRLCLIIIAFCLGAVSVFAQQDKANVRKGNSDFKNANFKEADIHYREALVKDSTSVAANYNLGNTLYKEGDYDGAIKVMENARQYLQDSKYAANYHYNRADAALQKEDYATAVKEFRQSLLQNPDDINAKENYTFAKKKLQDQQNQQNQQDQDQNQDQNQQNQDKQDQNKDQQNQDQNKDQNQDQQDKNRDQDKDQNKDQDQQDQQEQPKISSQQAQQMLQAIQAKEKETQDKVEKKKAAAAASRQKEKNW